MTLFYIANMRFPTERAHGIQVAHMCSAFARAGAQVVLIVPERETFAEDPFAYYGVKRNFRIEKIPVPDIVSMGKPGFLIESLVFAWRAAQRVRKGEPSLNPLSVRHGRICSPAEEGAEGEKVTVYTREELPLLFLPRERAFFEAHQLSRSVFLRHVMQKARGLITISGGLKRAIVSLGYSEKRIFVAHDGYDEKAFSVRVDKTEMRRAFGLPLDKTIALYAGGFEDWKGARTLCEAASFLKQERTLAAIIGGTEADIRKFSAQYPDVLFLGTRPYRELARNQQAADVLVVPNSGKQRISREFTSPLKLFAHMASGIPIVASDVSSLREVLSERNALLVPPDDPRALAEGISRALKNQDETARRAHAAKHDAIPFTWDKRAEHVLAYIRWLSGKRFS